MIASILFLPIEILMIFCLSSSYLYAVIIPKPLLEMIYSLFENANWVKRSKMNQLIKEKMATKNQGNLIFLVVAIYTSIKIFFGEITLLNNCYTEAFFYFFCAYIIFSKIYPNYKYNYREVIAFDLRYGLKFDAHSLSLIRRKILRIIYSKLIPLFLAMASGLLFAISINKAYRAYHYNFNHDPHSQVVENLVH